jgi:hypothetical protein
MVHYYLSCVLRFIRIEGSRGAGGLLICTKKKQKTSMHEWQLFNKGVDNNEQPLHMPLTTSSSCFLVVVASTTTPFTTITLHHNHRSHLDSAKRTAAGASVAHHLKK